MKYFMMIALALGLGACDGNDGNEDTGEVNSSCTDNCDDTDTPTGWAEYTVFVYDGFGAELDTALVFASTKTNIYDATSGETMSLPAPETYTVKAGSPADGTTSDGLPIIVGEEDYRWVTPAWTESFVDGQEVNEDIIANPYFYGEDVECDFYRNGEFRATYTNGVVETEDGYRLKFPESIGNGNWFEFVDGEVSWVGDKPDDGMSLLYFEYDASSVEFAYDSGYSEDSFVCRF